MTETIVDAEVVDEPGTDLVEQGAPPVALFKTDDPVEVIEQAGRVADALKDVLIKQQLVSKIKDKEFVKVEGWTTLAAMLGLSAVCTETRAVDGGYQARVEARMPDGRVVGSATALCTSHERHGPWKNAEDYARLSMAQTRATSKALRIPLGFVVALAGFESTPAEEIPAGTAAASATAGLAYGPPASEAFLAQTRAAIDYVIAIEPGADVGDTDGILSKLAASTSSDGEATYLPFIACRAICLLATRVKELRTAAATEAPGEGDPAGETPEERDTRERAERLAEIPA